MTIDTFFADLAAAARRLGYPLDAEAAGLLRAALHCTAEEWSDPAKRSGATARVRRTVLRAVMLALNSGSQYVDGRTMAVAMADAENAEVVQPTHPARSPHSLHPSHSHPAASPHPSHPTHHHHSRAHG